jgi:hypothetical protein
MYKADPQNSRINSATIDAGNNRINSYKQTFFPKKEDSSLLRSPCCERVCPLFNFRTGLIYTPRLLPLLEIGSKTLPATSQQVTHCMNLPSPIPPQLKPFRHSSQTSSTLKKIAIRSFEMPIATHPAMRRDIAEDQNNQLI